MGSETTVSVTLVCMRIYTMSLIVIVPVSTEPATTCPARWGGSCRLGKSFIILQQCGIPQFLESASSLPHVWTSLHMFLMRIGSKKGPTRTRSTRQLRSPNNTPSAYQSSTSVATFEVSDYCSEHSAHVSSLLPSVVQWAVQSWWNGVPAPHAPLANNKKDFSVQWGQSVIVILYSNVRAKHKLSKFDRVIPNSWHHLAMNPVPWRPTVWTVCGTLCGDRVSIILLLALLLLLLLLVVVVVAAVVFSNVMYSSTSFWRSWNILMHW